MLFFPIKNRRDTEVVTLIIRRNIQASNRVRQSYWYVGSTVGKQTKYTKIRDRYNVRCIGLCF